VEKLALAIFKKLCPICNGEITSERLEQGLPCSKCLPDIHDKNTFKKIEQSKWGNLLNVKNNVITLNNFFKLALGSEMWSAQKLWAKRIFQNKSFAIVAPTGSGKTVFGIILSIYLSMQGKKVLFILPTSILVEQVSEKAEAFIEKVKASKISIAYYHSFLTKKQKEEMLNKIKNNETNFIIVTSNFVSRYHSFMVDKKFDLVFVDDVDSILRSSKIFDKVLEYIGFDKKTIQSALQIVDLRSKASKMRRLGRTREAESYMKMIEDLKRNLNKVIKKRKIGTIIVSGASLRGRRTRRIKLFKELLNFDVGSKTEYLRNIVDSYVFASDLKNEAIKLVKKLGSGGIIFVPQDKGLGFVKELDNAFKEAGIRSEAYIRPRKGILRRFSKGEVDVLIGLTSYKSPLTRGIDLPHVIKYAVFVGVPKFKLSLNIDEFKPSRMIILLANIRDYLDKDLRYECDKGIAKLRNIVMLYREQLKDIIEAIKAGRRLVNYEGYAQKVIISIYDFLKNILSDKEILAKIKESPTLRISEGSGEISFILADPIAYIQGSGRTSRLYSGGISKGLAVTIVDDDKAFKQLSKELSYRLDDFKWYDLAELDLDNLIKEISDERVLIKEILEGKTFLRLKDPIKTALLVVESPNKARTISRFYGVPNKRIIEGLPVYEVNTGDKIIQIAATGGHLLDLITNEGIYGILNVDGKVIPIYSTIKKCLKCGEVFTDDVKKCPKCNATAIRDSINIIRALRNLAFEVDEVLIGTDPDSEGEKIAWDVALAVRPYVEKINRIEFHEVTSWAIKEAMKKPRSLNENLVKAQIVRRIEDRWIGFGLSVIIQDKFDLRSLSAGRVQTPVLGWIIERYRQKLNSKIYIAQAKLENGIYLNFDLKVSNGWEARRKIKELKGKKVKVSVRGEKEEEIKPPPPFTTDSMLKDAALKLKMTADKAMRIAQQLFEIGLITYHRTDSTRVSPLGISIAKSYISEKFGEEYYQGRSWSFGSEGAHECIRPTKPIDVQELIKLVNAGILKFPQRLTRAHYSLYNLIFNRFIASQMKPARFVRTKYVFDVDSYSVELNLFTRIEYPGFTKVFNILVHDKITQEQLSIVDIKYIKSSKVKILTQGEIISLMKERGLGRPSTYAKIVGTLLKRRYVMSVGRQSYLIPLKKGIKIYEFLSKHYGELVSEERTKELLSKMDKIEEGSIDYQKVLSTLRNDLVKLKVLKLEE